MRSDLLILRRPMTVAAFIAALVALSAGAAISDTTAHNLWTETRSLIRANPLLAVAAARPDRSFTAQPEMRFDGDCVNVLNEGELTVKPDGTTVLEQHCVFRLLHERAFPLAEISIPFNASYQAVQVLHARTTRRDGRVIEVKRQDFQTLAPFNETRLYSDLQLLRFSMPAVENECTIDYAFKVTTRPLLMPGHFWFDWTVTGISSTLGGSFPVLENRLTVHAPAEMPISFRAYNRPGLDPEKTTSPDGKTANYTWACREVPAITFEPLMPDPSHVVASVSITSIDSWETLSRWASGLFAGQVRTSAQIERTVKELTAGKFDEGAKARALYDWVSRRVRYVGVQLGPSALKPHAAPEVFDKRYGDCKDKATLLIAMLKLAGMEARHALVSTDGGPISTSRLHEPGAFDHCIVLATVGGKDIWLDPTTGLLPYGQMISNICGTEALVIEKDGGSFRPTPPVNPAGSGCLLKITANLAADSSARMEVTWEKRGDEDFRLRSVLSQISPSQHKEMMTQVALSIVPGATVKSFSVPDANTDGPVILKFTLEVPSYASVAGNMLLVPAGRHLPTSVLSFSDQRVNPLIWQTRETHEVEIEVRAPDGYLFDEPLPDAQASAPFIELRRTSRRAEDKKTLTTHYMLTYRPAAVPAAQFDTVRAFFASVSKMIAELTSLRKAGNAP